MDAARSVAKLVQAQVFSSQSAQGAMVSLGGWSYGGVVALEAAQLLAEVGISVVNLHLFDAPIQPSSNQEDLSSAKHLATVLTTVEEQQHFQNCVGLLEKYHQTPTQTKLDRVPIYNFLSSSQSLSLIHI
eukprot:TRINITY_DN7111_c0_g1_i1.p1 TRINITY_DN7111_c0_g1~~TRINITY_DN7111_c0_g1_i1.p1  ORF type:complete len:130 (-),score=21.28 TRINITY_DN7111_c0_g1_i1:117-506(-)